MSRYRKIEVRIFSDEKFRRLTPIPPCGQGLLIYLLTGPHTGPIPGLSRVGRAAMAEDLGWNLEAFDKAFGEVFGEGMVKADFESKLVWLPKALLHNKPESANVIKSWRIPLDILPECPLKQEAIEGMREILKDAGNGYLQAFDEILTPKIMWLKASGKTSSKTSRKPLGKPLGKPSGKTCPNQEQEQEQEIKEEASAVLGGSKSKSRTPSAKQGEPWNPEWLEKFWDTYPNRRGLDEVSRFWNERRFDEAEILSIMEGLAGWKKSPEWIQEGGRYIPKPLTFLKEGRYTMKIIKPRRNELAH